MENEKKISTNPEKAPTKVPTTEAKPAAPKSKRADVIKAFASLSPAERIALYHELGAAVSHDADLNSQGLKADNSKYEQL